MNQYYGIRAVIAVGLIGGLGYYIYRTKQPSQPQPPEPPKQLPRPPRTAGVLRDLRLTSLRWIKSILSYKNKMDKKSIVNDLYQVAVISVLAVGYSMPGKKILPLQAYRNSILKTQEN